MVNESINVNQGVDYVSYVSKTLTDKLVDLLNQNGVVVSSRWASLVVLFIALAILFIGVKITKPIIKWAMVILGILIMLGLLVPW